jgi:hypothetical protein
MSRGILHLAVTGQVQLQLQYRNLRSQLDSSESCTELNNASSPADDVCCAGFTYDPTYLESLI